MSFELTALPLRNNLDSAFLVDFEKKKVLNERRMNFITMASHELRSPLTTILLSINLLDKYKHNGESEKMELHMQRIKDAIGGMRNMLDYFLRAGKEEDCCPVISSETMTAARFFQGVQAAIHDLSAELKQGQKIKLVKKGNLSVHTNNDFVRNILINLLTNAIKFSSKNSPISVLCEVQQDDLVISVRDAGVGISENDLEKLSTRFFRAQNTKIIPGTGMGLHIIAKYLELMNGKIEIQSKINEGSCFIVTIPRLHMNSR